MIINDWLNNLDVGLIGFLTFSKIYCIVMFY